MDTRILQEAEFISTLDPLDINSQISTVQWINNKLSKEIEEKEVMNLVSITRLAYENALKKMDEDYLTLCAILRDLWFLIASIRAIPIKNPFIHIPEAENIMMQLWQKTHLVPRDNLLSYTLWNPPGSRRRSFTWTKAEDGFITALNMSYSDLLKAIPVLLSIMEASRKNTPIETSKLLEHLTFVNEKLWVLVKAMMHVQKTLPWVTFAEIMKRNFHPLKVWDKVYDSPCWWALPIIVIDRLLYGDSSTLSVLNGWSAYNEFVSKFYPYLPMELQNLVTDSEAGSVFWLIMDRWIPEEKQKFIEILTTLIRFRAPHYTIAYRNIPVVTALKVWGWSHWLPALKNILEINTWLLEILKRDKV